MRKATMKLSRIITGVAIATALAIPATANASTMPPGGGFTMPGSGGAAGVCTINGVKYGKIKMPAPAGSMAFTEEMCKNDRVKGTWQAGATATAEYDPTSSTGGTPSAPPTGGTPSAPASGGTSTGSGTPTAPAPSAGSSTGTQSPTAGGATGACTIGGKQYGSAKMGPISKPFDENMCKLAQGTFAAGGTSTAIFDASTVAPPAGGTPAAPGSTTGGATPTAGGGGSLASLIGGGSVPGVCKVSGVSYAKVEAMPGQSMPFMEMMCKGLPGGE